MPMMDVRHVSMLVLGLRMLVFMRMSNVSLSMGMEIFVFVDMFMHNRHMDMKMSMLLVRQQQRACDHQHPSNSKQQRDRIVEDQNGKKHPRQWRRPIQRAGARRAQSAHGVDKEHRAESVGDKAKQENTQDGGQGWESLTQRQSKDAREVIVYAPQKACK